MIACFTNFSINFSQIIYEKYTCFGAKGKTLGTAAVHAKFIFKFMIFFKILLFYQIIIAILYGCNLSKVMMNPNLIKKEITKKIIRNYEKNLYDKINFWRIKQGKKILTNNLLLKKIARLYSKDMSQRNFFSHTDPDKRFLRERLLACGIEYSIGGENLAKISNIKFCESQLLKAWIDSKTHRENLLSDIFSQIGIGIFINSHNICYITTIFIAP